MKLIKRMSLGIGLLLIGAVVATGVFSATRALSLPSVFGGASEERNTQVITAIKRQQEVALLSLHIEGIDGKKTNGKLPLIGDMPWSKKAVFLRYGFDAKLGLDGKKVSVTSAGENSFLVALPAFILIGLDNQTYSVATESDQILSWTAPEIDKVAMINSIVNDDFEGKYIEGNIDILRDQAKAFYTGIIQAVAPDAVLEFTFAQ